MAYVWDSSKLFISAEAIISLVSNTERSNNYVLGNKVGPMSLNIILFSDYVRRCEDSLVRECEKHILQRCALRFHLNGTNL